MIVTLLLAAVMVFPAVQALPKDDYNGAPVKALSAIARGKQSLSINADKERRNDK